MDILSFLLGLAKGKSMTTAPGDVDKELDTINGEVIGEEEYTVTFLNYDGSFLHEAVVNEGYNCPDPVSNGTISKPIKPDTRYIAYTYSGWSDTPDGKPSTTILSSISGDMTVYAVFASEYIYVAKGSYIDGYNDFGSYVQTHNISWMLDPDYVLTISGEAFGGIDGGKGNSHKDQWLAYAESITKIIIDVDNKPEVGSGIPSIGVGMFRNCTALTSVEFKKDISYIAGAAFEGTTSLSSIIFPVSMKSVQGNAFSGSGLTSATLQTPTWYWIIDRGIETPEVTQLTAEQVADTAYIAGLLTSGLSAQLSTSIV